MIGPMQIALVVGLALLMFGGKKIPELMKGLGTGIKEFKDATKSEEELAEKSEEIKKSSEEKK
ncbi:twin-arginine translocase TatA/TatE family subunit [Tenacibaculum dicentrarchi]|nr:twin-arginine translocase TatA/TatE family subunit [Tenacibaculum dicentrarchi]MCD8404122.1 twin-arginine translocase TatA/TatE family subunit [Tenacibaculum dicentrarchi]MCD8407087.1 twin-arginine translocase TatA/TatE family subunit [Tenacibaculum dicentrarchi]MCD8413936.1 twin-arginine translocase TatA/TatE family subunit [Tenacibaculum dicentrarchi]MCD8419426.1 twin-arginine translocase TatA/TatE family subunit [Tenacibaculum dicentrarchi]MCD8424442.1 twin-arginine translocase TatA/TatE